MQFTAVETNPILDGNSHVHHMMFKYVLFQFRFSMMESYSLIYHDNLDATQTLRLCQKDTDEGSGVAPPE